MALLEHGQLGCLCGQLGIEAGGGGALPGNPDAFISVCQRALEGAGVFQCCCRCLG